MKEFEELDRQLNEIIDEYNKIGDKGEWLEAQILKYSDAWSKKKLDAKCQELEEIDDKMSELHQEIKCTWFGASKRHCKTQCVDHHNDHC
jgi:hypothetical protein